MDAFGEACVRSKTHPPNVDQKGVVASVHLPGTISLIDTKTQEGTYLI